MTIYRHIFSALAVTGMVFTMSAQAAHHGKQDSNVDAVVEKRIDNFKTSGRDIQAIFKTHLGAGDFAAIEAAATKMADWADKMPVYFPQGSKSEGAKPAIWENQDDFSNKVAANAAAARHLAAMAASGDKAKTAQAAKDLGATCKSCHQSYRNKK